MRRRANHFRSNESSSALKQTLLDSVASPDTMNALDDETQHSDPDEEEALSEAL